jgi:hypothetical protein
MKVSITDVASMLGRDFAEYTFLPAQGMRGGILMAWRPDCIKIGTYSVSLHSVTVKVIILGGSLECMGHRLKCRKLNFWKIRNRCQGP